MTGILFQTMRIWHSRFKCNYLKYDRLLLNFLLHWWNLHQILKILTKKMIVTAHAFPKLQIVKDFIWRLSKKRRFTTPFYSQHVKGSQILLKSAWEHFYHIFSCFWWKLIGKTSLLVIGEILGVFVNTLTNNDKYPLQNCEDLLLPIQVQLCKKRKIFPDFLFHFGDFTYH